MSTQAELEGPVSAADPEFEALPPPRRPWRRLTLALMVATTLASVAMLIGLRSEIQYALSMGPPAELGALETWRGGSGASNAWVHGSALLRAEPAARYSRPLDSDEYRLVQVAGNERLWVQVRVPGDLESKAYVPPTSLVGRLLPLHAPGLRHAELPRIVSEMVQGMDLGEAWVLVDGESPATTRWVLSLAVLFLAFAAFNVYGLVRLLGPAKERRGPRQKQPDDR